MDRDELLMRLENLGEQPHDEETSADAEIRERIASDAQWAQAAKNRWAWDRHISTQMHSQKVPEGLEQRLLERLAHSAVATPSQTTRRRWMVTGMIVAVGLMIGLAFHFFWPTPHWNRQRVMREAIAWYFEHNGKRWPKRMEQGLPARPVAVPGGRVFGSQSIDFLGQRAEAYSLVANGSYALAIVVDRQWFSDADLANPLEYSDRVEIQLLVSPDQTQVCILVGQPIEPFLEPTTSLL